jgi:Lon protease-like protein
MDDLPKELGVFLLPQTVLFPDALLPLHVFEPRYQALVEDAAESAGRFLMGVFRAAAAPAPASGVPAMYPLGCIGRMVERQLGEDGSWDVIVRGEAVVTMAERKSPRPYRLAAVTPLAQGPAFADEPGAEERFRELRRLLELACPGCVSALQERWPGIFERCSGDELLHTVAMHLPVSVEQKLAWLGCAGSLSRWEMLSGTLREMGEARGERQRALGRYHDLLPEDPGRN